MGAAVAGTIVGPAIGTLADVIGIAPTFCGVAVLGVVLAAVALRTPPAEPEGTSTPRELWAALHDGRVAAGIWLIAVPGLLFGTVGVLAPLRLDDLGAGAGVIGAAFLAAGALESGVSPVVGRVSDRRGRLFPCLIALAAGATLMLLFPLPQKVWQLDPPRGARGADDRDALGAGDGDALATAPRRSGSRRASRSRSRTSAGRWATRSARPRSAGLADATSDAVPYLLLCVICAATLARPRPRPPAIAAAHVTPFWLDQPGPGPAPAARRPRGGRPGRGRRRPDRAVGRAAGRRGGQARRPARGRAARVRRVRPQRRLLLRLAHPRDRQRPRALARRARAARADGPREPRRDPGGDRAPRDRLRVAGARRDRGRHRRAPAAVAEEEAELLRAHGWDAELLDGAGDARPGELADVPGRAVDPRRLGARRPGAAVLGPGAGGGGGRRPDLRGHARHGARPRRRRRPRRDARRPRARARRAARHERLPAARARDRALRRARLRLRAGDRAAVGGAARRGRLGRAARGSPT